MVLRRPFSDNDPPILEGDETPWSPVMCPGGETSATETSKALDEYESLPRVEAPLSLLLLLLLLILSLRDDIRIRITEID